MRPTAVYLGWQGSEVSTNVESLLRERLDVVFAREFAFGEPFDQDEIAPHGVDYLFSFGPLIVRKALLDRVRRAAVNLHTGPPRWPGRGSVSFALLEDDAEFGVTAHLMAAAVDAGPILHVVRFPISADDDVESLDARTKSAIPELAETVLDDLLASGEPRPSGDHWERAALTQAELLERMRILDGDDESTVVRKIRAFAHPAKPGPYVERFGHRFWYRTGDGLR